MLEIKSYDDWSEDEEELDADQVNNLKKYTDYVRSSYYKAGQLNDETDSEIQAGVADRLTEDGVFSDETTDEERQSVFSSIVGPKQNTDTDARFVFEHLRTGSEDDIDPNDTRSLTLSKYLTLRQAAPDQAEELRQSVDEILSDRTLVKRSKISAVDRGDYSMAAIDEDDGSRSLYTGATAKSDSVPNEVDALLTAGAISSSDLYKVNSAVQSLNGGLSNVAEASRYEMFRNTVGNIAKNDSDLNSLIQSTSADKKEEKVAELRTTGETILEGAKTAIAYPFVKLGELVYEGGAALMGKEEDKPKYAEGTKVSEVLASNKEIAKKFSAEEIEKFSDALTTKVAGAAYRADKPETGIATDSMGNTIIATQLLANKQEFEKAVAAAPLNADQQKQARVERETLLTQSAGDLKKVILDEEPDAAGVYAKAKADGLTDAQFVEQWVSDPKNYDGFNTRLEQFGKSAWKTLAEIPLGVAALSGNEWAAKEMGKMIDDQSRRQEYSRLFGDEYGLGFQIINTIPQVATDIGLTIGTAGGFAGAKALAKTGAASARSMLRTTSKFALSNVDETATAAFREASTVGGEAALGNAFREVGRSLATSFGENAPVFATSFVRSAGSTYGSIYNQLPDTMSHEEKHKNALGYSLASGLSTAVITTGMSALGKGGVEDIATKRIRAMLGGETDEAVLASGGRAIPVDKMNYRQAKAVYENLKNESVGVTDAAFQKAMRGAISSTYKNWVKTTMGGTLNEALEESIDQSIQMKLEDAALDKETPLSEKISQVFNAGLIGGALGGISAGATQFGPVKKSELSMVYEARASALEGVAKKLRETKSDATATFVQRQIDDARARANASLQADIQAEKAKEMRAQTEKMVDPNEKQLSNVEEEEMEMTMLGDLVGQRVSAAGVSGILETGDDGMMRITTKSGDILNLGSKYEKASGRVSAYPKLMTTAVAQDGVPAGTPYITRGKKDSTRIAMPAVTETNKPENFLGVIKDEEGNIQQLVVKGAPLLANQGITMDVKISNGYQMNSLARYYNVDLNSLQDLTPPPVEAAAEEEAETEETAAVSTTGVVVAPDIDAQLYKSFMAGDSSKARFKQKALALNIDDLNSMSSAATSFFDRITADDTITPEEKKGYLQKAEEFKNRIALASKIIADKAEKDAVAEQPALTDEEKKLIEDELDDVVSGERAAPTEQVSKKPRTTPTKTAAKEPTAPKQTIESGSDSDNLVLAESDIIKKRKALVGLFNKLGNAPVVTTDSGDMTLEEADKYRSTLQTGLDLETNEDLEQEYNSKLSTLLKNIALGKKKLASRTARLRQKIEESLSLDVEADSEAITESQKELEFILSSITPALKQPVEAKEKRIQREAGEDWSTEDKLNLFRNEAEEKAFNQLVDNGFVISNLYDWGASVAGKVQEALGLGDVPLFTKKRFADDPTNPNKYLKGKHILLRRKVLERFPLVKVNTKSTPAKTKKNYTNSETGEYKALDIPVFRDENLDIISGGFTNDVHVTRAQIDQNIETFIPKDLIDKHDDPSDTFRINQSIDFDRATGRVMSVIDPVTLEPIRFSGQSYHTTMANYAPLRGKQMMSLVSAIIPPTASRLVNAGPTPAGRQSIEGRGLPAKEYINDFQAFLGGQYVDEEGNVVKNKGRGYSLLKSSFGLDDNSIADLSSYALADYAVQVYEFAIGTELKRSLVNALQFDGNAALVKKLEKAAKVEGIVPPVVVPKERIEYIRNRLSTDKLFELAGVTVKTLRDINPVKVVSNFFYTKSTSSIASVILELYPQFSGGSPQAVIAKYAEALFNKVNDPKGDLYTGVKKAQTILGYYGRLYQKQEMKAGIRKEQYTPLGPESTEALDRLVYTGKLDNTSLDPLFMSSREMYDDSTDAAIVYGDTLRNELISAVNNTPELQSELQDIVSLFDEGLSQRQGANLIDALNNVITNLGGDNRNVALSIVQRLRRGELESGLKAAGIMSELGWLPPVARYTAVPPTVEAPAELESPTASRERLAEIIQSAKDSSYRAGGKTTPQEEAQYRRAIAQAVELVQPEVLAASARAEELQRKAELRSRYANSLDSIINIFTSQKGADKFNAVVSKLNSDIKNSQSRLEAIDGELEGISADLEEATAAVATAESRIQKSPKKKKTESVDPVSARDMAVSNLKYFQRGDAKLRREQDVLTKFIERIFPITNALDSPAKLDSVFKAINDARNKANQEATHYTKASRQSLLKAKNIARDTAAAPTYTTLTRRAAGAVDTQASRAIIDARKLKMAADTEKARAAAMRLYENKSSLYKAANDVNSEAQERAARQQNAEDMLRFGLYSNDPESVLDALKIISKSNVESHREVAKLLLLAPDFVRSVGFQVVDLRADWAGIYDSGTNTVLVNLAGHNGRGLADVLLHEYLHAATVTYFNNPRNAEQRAAVARINQLRELATVQATKSGMMRYAHVRRGLSNNAEFLTYTLTAPEFQASLATFTPVGQRSLLSRLVDAILSFFGKQNTLLNKSVKELLDFSEMALANFHTFNISSARDLDALSEAAQDIKADIEDKEYFDRLIQDINNDRPQDFYRSESEINKPFDALEEVRRIMPAGMSIEIDDTMVGAMGARRSKPNTIIVNSKLINDLGFGLSPSNARAVVRTAVDEELAHLASYSVFTEEDFTNIADQMGERMRNLVADMLYSNTEPNFERRQALIAADRESGVLRDSDLAVEWVRSEMTRMAVGRTREEHIAFLYTSPSLMDKFLEAVRAFIQTLKERFTASPTTSTAAKISQASRMFRSLRNGGVLPEPQPATEGEMGDSVAFFNVLDGNVEEGQEDRTRFMLPVAGTNKGKVDSFWQAAQNKMYDLPIELRKFVGMRDGTISEIEYTLEDFKKTFPKLRDQAVNSGIPIEDIGKLLGTTAPAVQGEARKEIQRKVREFKKENADKENLQRLAEDYEAEISQPEADKFYAEFRKDQKALEDSLRAKGFTQLVDYLVEFRQQINKYKAVINFDSTNDVYLTRTFKFFHSEGWALAAKAGGVLEVDGKVLDFNKLRVAAAKHFEWEVENDAKEAGQTLTQEQKERKTIEALDKYLLNLEKEAEESKQLGAMNTIKRDVNRLLRKKDFDEPLRLLLGEVTDPFENAVRTIFNVGRLAANDRFLRNFAQTAIDSKLANREGGKDMELLFHPSQNAELGDLAGLYVRKDIAAAIRQELGPKGRDQETRSMGVINGFGRVMSKFSGLTITTQTLGSVGFYPRNILGGVALTTAQGIVNPIYAKESFRLAVMSSLPLDAAKADSKETRDTIRRLTELQILGDETRGRIAMDMLRGFAATTDEQLEELVNDIVDAQTSGRVDKILTKYKIKQVGQSTVDFLAGLNNIIDSAFKLNAYAYELNVLKDAYGNTEPLAKLEAEAARKVKLTFPTHSQQISFAKSFNRSPYAMLVLPFVRWKSEVLRTMLNTVPLAMQEINSGNATIKARGIKRMVGFTSTMLGGGVLFGGMFATLFSFLTSDDEEEKGAGRKLTDDELDAIRDGLPSWQRNHGIFARLVGKDGVQVIDMSNILPYSQVTDIAKLAMRGNIKGMADYITGELIGTQIAANALLEVSNNRTDFDQPIWLSSDNAAVAFGKMLAHIGKGTLLPSAAKKTMDVLRFGQQDKTELIVGELTGARPMIHKIPDIEYRAMSKIKKSMDETVSLLYPLSSGRAFDPNDVEGVIDKHQSASNINQKRLFDFMTNMRTIGSTDESLMRTAAQIKISKQRMGNAMNGLNSPWTPNDQWFQKMYQNKIRVGEQNPDEIASKIAEVVSRKSDQYNSAIE
jgi:hypothetical protein